MSFTGTFGEQGVRYTLTVAKGDQEALSRQVVKSDNATVTVPELEFEIPAATQKGSITTVEGLLMDAASNIRLLQEERRAADPATAKLIDDFLEKLDSCTQGDRDFTVVVDDPAGNSYVESPGGNARQDALLQVRAFTPALKEKERTVYAGRCALWEALDRPMVSWLLKWVWLRGGRGRGEKEGGSHQHDMQQTSKACRVLEAILQPQLIYSLKWVLAEKHMLHLMSVHSHVKSVMVSIAA